MKTNNNVFQNFSTILALVLPLLQVFFGFIPESSEEIFLFADNFLTVSIIAAIFAYIFIIAFKNTPFFALTLNRKKKKENDDFQHKIDQRFFEQEEIIETIRSGIKKPPYYITPRNSYYVLLPTVILMFILFLAFGMFFKGTETTWVIFTQAVLYIFLVALTSLTLGVFYINDVNKNKAEQQETERWPNIQKLLFETRSLPEFPIIEFVSYLPIDEYNHLDVIIRVKKTTAYGVNQSYYHVRLDRDARSIKEIKPMNPSEISWGEEKND